MHIIVPGFNYLLSFLQSKNHMLGTRNRNVPCLSTKQSRFSLCVRITVRCAEMLRTTERVYGKDLWTHFLEDSWGTRIGLVVKPLQTRHGCSKETVARGGADATLWSPRDLIKDEPRNICGAIATRGFHDELKVFPQGIHEMASPWARRGGLAKTPRTNHEEP